MAYFSIKVAKIYVDFLGKTSLLSKNLSVTTFFASNGKTWAPFYFHIWSHCTLMRTEKGEEKDIEREREREVLKERDRKKDRQTKIDRFALGRGRGSVGRAVPSDTRGLQFESSRRHIFIYFLSTVSKRRK